MDKKNLTLGIVFLLAAFAVLHFGPHAPPASPTPDVGRINNPLAANQAAAPATTTAPATSPADATFAAVQNDTAGEKITHLGNAFIDVAFTDYGGAIKDVTLRKFPVAADNPKPYVFNARHADPMLALMNFPGLDRNTRYRIVSHTARDIVFEAVLEKRIEVTRRYAIEPGDSKTGDPYQLRSETAFRNLTGETTPLPGIAVSLGTAAPVDSRDPGIYLDTGYFDGKSANFIARAKLQGGGFLGFNRHDPLPFIETTSPIVWASVKNQFFASILTPDQPGVGLITRRIELPPFPDSSPAVGVTGSVLFNLPALAPHGESKLGMNFYVGPKEYKRLANADIFKHDQDQVMEFGKFFGLFSKLLLELMSSVHNWAPNWGLAIILTTLIIKIFSLPFTIASARSARRMQAIQPLIKDLREKFKDNPKKLSEAQMALFKQHKVNPVGGCLPMLITFPFFIGFFSMLRSASELRLAPFLWAHDLSAPDTIAHIAGFPINPLPLVMGCIMMFQMQLVPQPTVDNAQAKMMRFMPLMTVAFYYNYSCALSLYSTVNSLFMILQQLLINRMKDDGDPTHTTVTAGGKPVKNVTPAKKKLK